MSHARNTVICAAGTGSRLGLEMPKCLVHVAGRPIIHWQLDLLEDMDNIVIVVGYQSPMVMQAVRRKRSNAAFIINHNYRTTNTLDSLMLGVEALNEPFIYLDGDLLLDAEAVDIIQDAPCPSIGIKRTYSEEPVCVHLDTGPRSDYAVGFTREVLDYEWTGLAKLDAGRLKQARVGRYVYQAVEELLPVVTVRIDCYEVDTKHELEEAERWMRHRIESEHFGKIAVNA